METKNTGKLFLWLKDLKVKHKVSYNAMASAIGYTGPGISKAIKKESLSFNQVKKIAQETGFSEDFSNLFETESNESKVSETTMSYGESDTIEDRIANRVVNKIKPMLEKLCGENLEIIKLLAEQALELDEIKDLVEQTKDKVVTKNSN
jgi:transcriptional regulator with XRE-family HTH domain